MINKAFAVICDKVEESLKSRGFIKQKVSNADNQDLAALFTGESTAYMVMYSVDKMHMVMKSCDIVEEELDNDWRLLATWMFNPEADGLDQAKSIGNDFAEIVMSPSALRKVRQQKKKKTEGEGSADPMFLCKRFVTLFPDLKDEIKDESERYFPFCGATFVRDKLLPKVSSHIKSASKQDIEKIAQILNVQYQNGDMDTRSIITIVILNGLEESQCEQLKEHMNDDLKKAFDAAKKFKGKNVKPAKRKAQKKTIAERLSKTIGN